MDRAIGVVLLLLCGIAIGAGGSRMWQWSEYVDALERERDLVGKLIKARQLLRKE